MYSVEGRTINISSGDTGALEISVEGYSFGADDRALFSIKDSQGRIVKQKAYAMEDNTFVVTFHNADTDKLPFGTYNWDVRYVIHPYYDESGNIVDGNQVLTPELPMAMQILNVVGEI